MRLGIDTPDLRNALAEIYLDGKLMYDVIEVDDQKGELTRYVRDANGRIKLAADGVSAKTEVLHGTVVIVLPSEQEMAEFLDIVVQNTESTKK